MCNTLNKMSDVATDEDAFLAEKVIDSGFGEQDGKRYYKVKWVRYTWESEDHISHLKDLLDVFWSEHEAATQEVLPTQELLPTTEEEIENNGTQGEYNLSQNEEKNSSTGVINIDYGQQQASDVDADDNIAKNTSIDLGVLEGNEQATFINDTPSLDKSPVITCSSSSFGFELHHNINNTVKAENDFFNDNKPLINHYDRHGNNDKEDVKPACDVCFRTYNSVQALKTHKKTHNSEKPFQCEHCLKCFSERSTLKRHAYIHLAEKPFKCDHCQRAFSDKSTLRRHMITHTGAKRFHCTSCDKRFTRNEHLRQHKYIHTAQKLYRCEVCDKDFRQRSTLKNHMLLHRAERYLTCGKCGAAFSRQLHYDKHVASCTNNGLPCEICVKRFPDEFHLKRHLAQHHSRKEDATNNALKCPSCDETFFNNSLLRTHLLTHSKGKPFQCTLCLCEFSCKSSFLQHISAQHSDQLVLEIMQPGHLGLNNKIVLQPGVLGEQVQYVLQNTTGNKVSNYSVIGEESAPKVKNGEAILMSNGEDGEAILTSGTGSKLYHTETPNLLSEQSLVAALHSHDDGVIDDENVMLCGNQENPSENPSEIATTQENSGLVRVQIVKMANGNNFVHSLEPVLQNEEEEGQRRMEVSMSSSVDDLIIDTEDATIAPTGNTGIIKDIDINDTEICLNLNGD